MYAIVATEPGGPEVLRWTEQPDPDLPPGHVLLDVAATAVNRADLLQRRGLYPPPPGASDILGLECSGVISELGEGVTGWNIGDKVCALLTGGGYAEKVAVPASQLLPVPKHGHRGRRVASRDRVHGVVERRDDRRPEARRRPARPRWRRRHRHTCHPGGQGARREGGGDGLGRQTRPLPRTRRRPGDRLPRTGLRLRGAHCLRWRRRGARQHGCEVPVPEHRRPRSGRTARRHRHAGWHEG